MAEHPRDIVRTLDVRQDVGTYEAQYIIMRLQFRRDGSVTWTPIPPEEIPAFSYTHDSKTGGLAMGTKKPGYN